MPWKGYRASRFKALIDKQIAFAAFEQYWDARSLQTYMEEMYLQKAQNPSWWPAMLTRNTVRGTLDMTLARHRAKN